MTQDDSTKPKSWLDRISQALTGEPHDKSDLINVLKDAQKRELFNQEAMRMIEGVLQVSDMQVRDVMIPRAQMISIEEDQTLEHIFTTITESGHSRFPVLADTEDQAVKGILLAKDLLRFTLSDQKATFDLNALLRPVTFIPESKRLDVLLKEFKDKHSHLAIVVDEYGGTAGLVTIEDVIEQIVGDIEDEHDAEEVDPIQKLNDTEYLIDPLLPIEDFNAHFESALSDDDFDTVGGLVLHALGHLPKANETTAIDQFRFTVLKADSRRILELKLKLA
jgi:magnesium and cobalt transporter